MAKKTAGRKAPNKKPRPHGIKSIDDRPLPGGPGTKTSVSLNGWPMHEVKTVGDAKAVLAKAFGTSQLAAALPDAKPAKAAKASKDKPAEWKTTTEIPTSIGKVAHAFGEHVALIRNPTDDSAMLCATDGRAAAVVPTVATDEGNDNPEPRLIPASLANPLKDGARVLRSGTGPDMTLWGRTIAWYDEERGLVRPDGGEQPIPRFAEVFPPNLAGASAVFTVDTAALAALAVAVNSPEASAGSHVLTLALIESTTVDGKTSGKLIAIGEPGIGVILTVTQDHREGLNRRYTAVRDKLHAIPWENGRPVTLAEPGEEVDAEEDGDEDPDQMHIDDEGEAEDEEDLGTADEAERDELPEPL